MIYAVMYVFYSDWKIYGYFTKREEAEKYVVKHHDMELHIEELECFDGCEDLSNIVVRYERRIIFNKFLGSWECREDGEPDLYQSKYPRSNSLSSSRRNEVKVFVNTTLSDLELQKKIAQDIFYQYLDFCGGNPTQDTIEKYNKILSKEEDERKEAEMQEQIRQEELQELKRLKEKYEQ